MTPDEKKVKIQNAIEQLRLDLHNASVVLHNYMLESKLDPSHTHHLNILCSKVACTSNALDVLVSGQCPEEIAAG